MTDELESLLDVLEDTGPQIHRLLVRITGCEEAAGELLQQLYLNLLQRKRKFPTIENHGAYLKRAAIHMAFNWRRSRKSRHTEDLPGGLPDTARLPPDDVELRDQIKIVLGALDELPQASREVVALRFLEDQSYEDIGELLGKTPHQVRSLCNKGMQMLRRKLQRVPSAISEDE